MKRGKWILAAVLAVMVTSAAAILLHLGYLLPLWISWEQREISAASVEVCLANKKLDVLLDGTEIWTEKLPVQDVLLADIDHDEEAELMVLCWKRGRYGERRPFWVEKDQKTWSQHIYIYDLTANGIKPVWMASDLGMEVSNWSFSDHTRLLLTNRQKETTAWDWETWGLVKVEPTTLTFAAVGDNLIHRQIYDYAMRNLDGSFDHLYAQMLPVLAQYDVTSINQETVFVEKRGEYSDYPLFGTPVEVGHAIIDAGFDIVSCATNHALDKGTEAVDRTVELFAQAGVLCAGAQHSTDPVYRPFEMLTKNGIRVAVLAYTQSTNGIPLPEDSPYAVHLLEEEQVREDLAAATDAADLVLVYAHWGMEYAAEPDETQRYWAQLFADCGADVVIGTHPHVVQPVEWIAGKNGGETLVYYSLGNYVSAQTEEACTRGGLAYFTVEKANGQCSIVDHGLKYLLTEQHKGRYTTKLEEHGAF